MTDFELLDDSDNLFGAVTCICEFDSPKELVEDFRFLHQCIGRFDASYERFSEPRFITLVRSPTVSIDLFGQCLIGDPLGVLYEVSLQVEQRFFYSLVRHLNAGAYRSSVFIVDPERELQPIIEDRADLQHAYAELRREVKAFESSKDAQRLLHSVESQCGAIYSEVRRSETVGHHEPGENPITTESELPESSRSSFERKAQGRPSKDGTEEILTKWNELVASNDPRTEGLYGSNHLHRVLSRWLKVYFNHDRNPGSVKGIIRGHVGKLEANQSSTLKAVGNVDDNNPPEKLWGNFLSDSASESANKTSR